MTLPATLWVNARFLAEPVTGVQRFGRELLRELDSMLEEGEIDRGRYRVRALTPRRPLDELPLRHVQLRVAGPLASHAWEQCVLPLRARGFLLNLKGTAPVARRGGGLLVNDLQVFGYPEMHRWLVRAVYRWIQPRAARRAAVLFALSRFTAREMERWLNVPAAAVTVTLAGHEHALREAPDPSILPRHGIRPGSYILAVSSLNPNKNFHAVLRAIELAELRDVPFVVAGGVNPRVFRRSDTRQLAAGATVVGRVSDGELRALYESALAFAFPSFYEGFGLPPLEAMAHGCPVVLARSSSLPEVGGDAVLYCDPADPADLARQLLRLVHDAPLRAELAAKGRLRAVQFRWRDVARRVWNRVAPLLG